MPSSARRTVGPASTQLGSNGGFETGSLTPWTLSLYLNQAGVIVPPQSFSDLRLSSGTGVEKTYLRNAPTESAIPAGLDSGDSLRYPRYGNWAVVVNELGASYNANAISQTMTVGPQDIDPADGLIHVRFSVAPILQSGGHAPTHQPFFWIAVRNVSTTQTLFTKWNYAGEPGVPWQTSSGTGSVYFTDWQAFDIAPGSGGIGVGDEIEVTILAAGCSQGGHWGHVYVDGMSSFLPGLSVTARAPQRANAGSTITYSYQWRNGGQTPTANTVVDIPLPAQTTFASLNAPGLACTAPAAGDTGTVSCSLGTLVPATYGGFTMTVNVDAGATDTVAHGGYLIRADSEGALIGPVVNTQVTSEVDYADLRVSISDGAAAAAWGQAVTYTLEVANAGPEDAVGATVIAAVPTHLTGVTWSCSASGLGNCAIPAGSGDLNASVDLPVGTLATFTIQATVASGSGPGTVAYSAEAAVAPGIDDPDSTNNTGVDYNALSDTLSLLTVTKSGGGTGVVLSSPAAISCGNTCTGSFATGSQLSLTAIPDPNYGFLGWTGSCAGQGNPCVLTLTGDETVDAQFDAAYYVTASVVGGRGSISCTSPVASGGTSTCTITTPPGVLLASLTDEGVDVTGSVTGGVYTITSIAADHTVVATFQSSQGGPCTAADECSSNDYCVDEVCCATDCSGDQCAACDIAGSEGTCVAVTGAPHNTRPACSADSPGAACGGTCDGVQTASCSYPAAGAPAATACLYGHMFLGDTCNGNGRYNITENTYLPCPTNICANLTACTCSGDSDCLPSQTCQGGACTGPLQRFPGGTCSADSECGSGYCTDGVCCDSACSGQCQACDLPGSIGTCSNVPNGAPHGNRPACTGSPTGDCAGSCDGSDATACTYPDANISCRSASCSSGTATVPAVCDGAGSCPALQTQTCAPFICGASACAGDCTLDSDCAAGARCSAGVCVTTFTNGAACTADAQCASSHCTDGVCCDTACSGQCQACDLAGSVGTCGSVTGGAPHGSRPPCATDASGACAGTCDGSSPTACGYPGDATVCAAGACGGGTATAASVCNGQGACLTEDVAPCGNYACANNACKTQCADDTDCATGKYCSSGECKEPGSHGVWKAQGSACSASGSGETLGWSALIGLGLLLLRRKGVRLAGALAGVALVAQSVPARADIVQRSFNLDRFQLATGWNDLLTLHSGQVAPHLQWTFIAAADYADQPFRLVAPAENRELALVTDQTDVEVGGAVGLFDRF
ncbi:MAG TPA: hypothetical protein VEY30_10520, partial [Myxococcaceae bacterium]|nr:hypothetical protein [Myxococcaceae bacterium]